jgi:hypothetical protein
MTITKREFSAIDANPIVLYAKRNDGQTIVYPVIVSELGELSVSLETVTAFNAHTGVDELRIIQQNHICVGNTTAVALSAGTTFIGDWQDCLDYQEVNVSIFTDVDSAVNGLVMEWSADAVNVGDDDRFTVYANRGTNYTPNPAFRYLRVKFTNGGTNQTKFSLMTILRRGVTGGSFHRVDDTLKDDSDGRLTITVPKLKTAANTYVSQQGTNQGNAKISIEELDETVAVNNNSTLKVALFDADNGSVKLQPRSQNPTGSVLQVQIGPADVVSNIPVVIDYEHHQVHEGEAYIVQYVDLALDTNTIKFGINVPTFTPADASRCPHLEIFCDVYNGSARIDLYESAAITGGTLITSYNRERNSAITAGTTILHTVTSVTGTLLKSFFAGGGTRASGSARSEVEMILKSNTKYRVDVTGLVAGTDAIIRFLWYEDLGV